MRILHMCLSNFYIDGYNYQENILPRINKLDGHEVMIIASTDTFIGNSKLGFTNARAYETNEGMKILRLPYSKLAPRVVMSKLRMYPGVYKAIAAFSPDVILFHGCCGYALLDAAKYKKKHSQIKLYVDNHSDFNNSGTNFLSKYILHKWFNRFIVQRALPYIDKVLYLSLESKAFLMQCYKIPKAKLEFYPLGGIVFDDHIYIEKRIQMRKKLGLGEEDILLVHSGKLDKQKRTVDILQAFARVPSENMHLLVIGSIPDEMAEQLTPLIETDVRVNYVGWKSADELMDYLCACDMYLQPGSQSATIQHAMCCRCAIMIYPHKSYDDRYLDGNGFYVKTVDDIQKALFEICSQPESLPAMNAKSLEIAQNMLDYKKLAARLYR